MNRTLAIASFAALYCLSLAPHAMADDHRKSEAEIMTELENQISSEQNATEDMMLADDEIEMSGEMMMMSDDEAELSDADTQQMIRGMARDERMMRDETEMSEEMMISDEAMEMPDDEMMMSDDEMEMSDDEMMMSDDEMEMSDDGMMMSDDEMEMSDDETMVSEEENQAPHWEYSGEHDPSHWGELSEDFKLCEVGRQQSPVNFSANRPPSAEPIEPIDLNYATVVFEVVNTGHTIQVNYPKGSTATIAGKTYDLLQIHFHTPSEHTVNSDKHAMEAHLVHKNEAGELAVIAAMIDSGEWHYDTSKIWMNIPEQGASKRSGLVVNAANFLPKGDRSYISYSGSLTTPPCTEGVTWVVMNEPITLSTEQIEAFQSLYPMNARPVQRSNRKY